MSHPWINDAVAAGKRWEMKGRCNRQLKWEYHVCSLCTYSILRSVVFSTILSLYKELLCVSCHSYTLLSLWMTLESISHIDCHKLISKTRRNDIAICGIFWTHTFNLTLINFSVSTIPPYDHFRLLMTTTTMLQIIGVTVLPEILPLLMMFSFQRGLGSTVPSYRKLRFVLLCRVWFSTFSVPFKPMRVG